jgi:type II secretory pathway component PulM
MEEWMTVSWPRGRNLLLVTGLITLMAFPQAAIAQDHVVSAAEIKKDLQAATADRKNQLAQVDNLLTTRQARKALSDAHIDYQQVHTAVQSLSDEDLAKVAAKADQAQKDFAAGDLSDRDLILIILAIAVLVLIIVAVR